MKKLTLLIILSIFTMIGCQDEDSLIQPQQDNDIISLDKISLNKGGDKDDDDSHYVYNLGDIKDYKVKASKNFEIDGKKGGLIELNVSWKYERKERVELEAILEIPEKAYKGKLEFDMIFNLQDYNLELYPSPFTFDKSVKLDLKFKNIDLAQFDDEKIDFNYIGDKTEKIKYKNNKIDYKRNTILVEEAELNHFSRYGWTRTTTTK